MFRGLLIASSRTNDAKTLGRSVPADTFVSVAVLSSVARSGGADLVDAGGVEVLDAVPVSVDWDGLNVVAWVGGAEGVEADTLRSVVVSAELAVGGGSDFVDVGGVEVVNTVEVSVNWDGVESVSWVTVGQSVESNTFGSVSVVTKLSRGGGADFTRVGGVEVVSAVPVSENRDLSNLDWDRLLSDDWLDVNVVNNRSNVDMLNSWLDVVVSGVVVNSGVMMMMDMMGHMMMMLNSLNNLRLLMVVVLHGLVDLLVVMALGLGQTDQEYDQNCR